jgi:hypothetical protein
MDPLEENGRKEETKAIRMIRKKEGTRKTRTQRVKENTPRDTQGARQEQMLTNGYSAPSPRPTPIQATTPTPKVKVKELQELHSSPPCLSLYLTPQMKEVDRQDASWPMGQ